MTADAELRVRLALRADRIASVAVTGTRTALPERLTRGRPADEVAQIIPRLYSICSHAQGAAAAGALEAARGLPVDDATLARRAAAVRHEAVQETITRLLIDWPQLYDEAPAVAAVAMVRRLGPDAAAATLQSIARERIFGTAPQHWMADRALASLERWCDAAPTLPARLLRLMVDATPQSALMPLRLLPAADTAVAAELAARLGTEPGYALTPDLRGAPVETGALARQSGDPLVMAFLTRHGNPAAARLLARLVELASWLGGQRDVLPAARQQRVDDHTGIGLAETARGLLLHRAIVRDGRVEDFRILAPTEWNFHPAGTLVRELRHRVVPDVAGARLLARRLAQSLDPCVALSVEVEVEAGNHAAAGAASARAAHA